MIDTSYIVGLGPPRSGTTSLAALLDGCEGATVTHEEMPHPMPWPSLPHPGDPDVATGAVRWLEAQPGRYVGDVGYYWLPYVLRTWRALAPHVQFLALVRRQEEWHRSFSEHVDAAVLTAGDTPSRRQFPMIHRPSETERQAAYYRRYTACLQRLVQEGAPLSVFHTTSLNTPRRLLRASPIKQDDWNVEAHHKNRRHG